MATYYIDTTGADSAGRSGANTSGQQWLSLAYAVTRVNSGDIIHINAGTYTMADRVALPVNVSIEGAGDTACIIRCHYVAGDVDDAFLVLSGGSNTGQHISGVRFLGDSYTGDNAIIIYNRDNVSIYDCTVIDFLIQGVRFDGTTQRTGNSLHDCTIDNSGGVNLSDRQANIFIKRQTGLLIYNNVVNQTERVGEDTGLGFRIEDHVYGCKIYDNEINGLQPNDTIGWTFSMEFWSSDKATGIGHGMEIYGNTIVGLIDFGSGVNKGSYSYAVSFHDNIVGNDTAHAYDDSQTGIEFEEICKDVYVYDNEFKYLDRPVYFCHNGTAGDFQDIHVYSNLIRNVPYNWSDGAGVTFAGSGHPAVLTNIYIRNNTILAHSGGVGAAGWGIWLDSRGPITNIYIQNNIVRGFATAPYGTIDGGGTIGTLVVQKNVVYGNGNSNNLMLTGITPSDLTNDGGIKSDPLFVSSSDFHLQALSPAKGTGMYLAITDDIVDVAYTNPPSIGAYEYVPTGTHTYYVSPTGNDTTGTGTISSPWYSLNKAWTVVGAGDTVYMRGGTYSYTAQQYLTGVNGSAMSLINVWAYNNEVPIITRGASFTWTGRRAILYFSGNYVHFKGIEVTGIDQQDTDHVWMGTSFEDFSNCIFERFNIHDCGLGGYWTGACDNNLLLNSDFHDNYDPITAGSPYENADGLNWELVDAGGTNIIRGCRFWNNSDDGLDLYGSDTYFLIENCWAWGNGFQEDQATLGGDGNGFKLGGNSGALTTMLVRIQNCIAYGNASWGYNENGSPHNMSVYNCISHANNVLGGWGGGFHLNKAGVAYYIKNNIAFDEDTDFDSGTLTNVDHNSWDLAVTVSNADFQSVAASALVGARVAGELPAITYLHLVSGSDLRGVGVAVSGLTLDGDGESWATPPSLGAYEYVATGPILVSGITVSGTGGATTITTDDGTLQMVATVLPSDATDNSVTWSSTNGTGTATISVSGILTAQADGTVTVRATANDGSGIYDDQVITLSNQVITTVEMAEGELDLIDILNVQYSIGDIRQLSFGNSNKSYTFSVPLTKANKKLLKFITEPDVNSEPSELAYVHMGDFIILQGKLSVLSYQNNSAKIIINSDDWIDALKNRKMTSLDLSASDHALTHAAVEDTWTGDDLVYRYPMIDFGALSHAETGSTAKWYPIDFVPMIRVVDLINLILSPYTISSTWLGETLTKNLYILGRETIAPIEFIQDKDLDVRGYTASDNQNTVSVAAGASGTATLTSHIVKLKQIVTDEQPAYDATTGIYLVGETGTHRLIATLVTVNTGVVAPFTETAGQLTIYIKQTGSATRTLVTLSVPTGIPNATTYTLDTDFVHLVAGDEIVIELSCYSTATNTGGAPANLTVGLNVSSAMITYWSNANRHAGLNKVISLEEMLPDMTQLDFLAAIRDMFNLRFFLDKNRQNLYIEPWDDFITTEVIDITEFIDFSDISVETISQSFSRTTTLKWKDDSSDKAFETYLKSYDSPGKKDIVLVSEFAKDGIDVREHPFSSTIKGYNATIVEHTTIMPRIHADEITFSPIEFNRKVGFNTRIFEWKGLTSGFTWYYGTETKTQYPKAEPLDFATLYSSYWIKLFHYIDKGKLFTVKRLIKPGYLTQFLTVIDDATREAFRPTYCIEISGAKHYFFLQKITSDGQTAEIELILKT